MLLLSKLCFSYNQPYPFAPFIHAGRLHIEIRSNTPTKLIGKGGGIEALTTSSSWHCLQTQCRRKSRCQTLLSANHQREAPVWLDPSDGVDVLQWKHQTPLGCREPELPSGELSSAPGISGTSADPVSPPANSSSASQAM